VIASGVYFHSWPVSVSRHLTLHSWKSLSLQNHVVKRMVRDVCRSYVATVDIYDSCLVNSDNVLY